MLPQHAVLDVPSRSWKWSQAHRPRCSTHFPHPLHLGNQQWPAMTSTKGCRLQNENLNGTDLDNLDKLYYIYISHHIYDSILYIVLTQLKDNMGITDSYILTCHELRPGLRPPVISSMALRSWNTAWKIRSCHSGYRIVLWMEKLQYCNLLLSYHLHKY